MPEEYTMDATAIILVCSTLLSTIINSMPVDTFRANQTIRDGETITSARGEFRLGFFSPGSSTNRYLGIWYKKISNGTVLWVANRDTPIKNNLGVVRVSDKGITLQTVDVTIWSSNVSKSMKNPVAQLLDSGNLVVREAEHEENNEKDFIWQSFDYPGDTLIAGMKAGIDLVTGLDRYYTSWKSADDPSTGSFTVRIDPDGFPQFFQFKGSSRWTRTGPWNGRQFSGSPKLNPNVYTQKFIFNEKEIYYMFDPVKNTSANVRITITPNGDMKHLIWNYQKQIWTVYFTEMVSDCDIYGLCGANDICNINSTPRCECLRGFVPKDPEKWRAVDWSSGCVRETELDCRTEVGFLKYSGLKLPDTRHSKYDMKISLEECGRVCLKNCNCTAYANADIRSGGSGCILWFNDLIDIKGYTADGQDIYVRMPASELVDSLRFRAKKRAWIILISLLLAVVIALIFVLALRKRKQKEEDNMKLSSETVALNKIESEDWELLLIDFKRIVKATDNFSQDNKLGEGGFGPVYKGMLNDGKEIAVKRLSKNSGQGEDEFINEVSCIAKLQHRNLVTLLGCCTEKGERILIYEYMVNKSLDTFIFDQSRNSTDWPKLYNIISGIARGLLYLHQDSKLRIIHRDLKASNILLDHEMNPKISDFGMARIFEGSQTEANTARIVGTYGYMSPEYAIDGVFSVKSDVYSFGVLILEMVSGKKNRLFSHPDHCLNLLGHAWKCYNEGKFSGLIDEVSLESRNGMKVLRVIQIGLLCVQQDPIDRPVMSEVVLMLSSNMKLPHPKKPGFFVERILPEKEHLLCNNKFSSCNQTITAVLPRD
ncbi:Receptor-like serine/threonine-protein kinase [Heracleum sosnowskyi]|uniref:Receptor-like serine/threonine-protein kinase n=1 Tax=Heracleum sosnowskyi TaxID=360622 RepID=A0AAD8IUQ5_9APIA|nr:Receptor-like serine/threonine-protein kinase [Heracleum sosnowskyi]